LEWGVTAREQEDVEGRRKMIEEKGHTLVNLRGGEKVIVFQDQKPAAGRASKGIENSREDGLERKGLKGRVWRCGKERHMGRGDLVGEPALTGSENVAPEARRIIVPGIKRDPGHRRQHIISTVGSDPLTYQCRFAEAGRGSQHRELARADSIQPDEEAFA
jgi:hypothetical protein